MSTLATRRFAMLGVALISMALVTAGESRRIAGAQDTGAIRVRDVWARAAMSEHNSAVYMRIENHGEEADRLVRAESEVARVIELHATVAEGGVMKMVPQEAIEVPPRSSVSLKPGGLHVMLIGLTRALAEGDQFPVRLHFARSGPIELTVPVRKAGAGSTMPSGHQHQHQHPSPLKKSE